MAEFVGFKEMFNEPAPLTLTLSALGLVSTNAALATGDNCIIR